MKQTFLNHIKNVPGWRTQRKIVIFSVDDYGNVRLDSKQARKNLDQAGLKIFSRFDAYDTLETYEDLEQLYAVLQSVKDKHHRSAVFTAFTLPCNIDFDRMSKEGNRTYQYELLSKTYENQALRQPQAYRGAWQLWQEGIQEKLLRPQFHGREHLNLKIFEDKLKKDDPELLANLENYSFTSISDNSYSNLGFTAAFSFQKKEDINVFLHILETGVDSFIQVFGYTPTAFTPPATEFPTELEKELLRFGIHHLDKPFQKRRHMGNGNYKKEWNFLGYKKNTKLVNLVRNVVFEPTDDRGFNWVDYTFKQVETAFFWGKPANISSHRVNFCGHIDPKNRTKGLNDLRSLLKKIVQKWPEVEFMSADALGELILEDNLKSLKAKV